MGKNFNVTFREIIVKSYYCKMPVREDIAKGKNY
jgi:hypothetical protein